MNRYLPPLLAAFAVGGFLRACYLVAHGLDVGLFALQSLAAALLYTAAVALVGRVDFECRIAEERRINDVIATFLHGPIVYPEENRSP